MTYKEQLTEFIKNLTPAQAEKALAILSAKKDTTEEDSE